MGDELGIDWDFQLSDFLQSSQRISNVVGGTVKNYDNHPLPPPTTEASLRANCGLGGVGRDLGSWKVLAGNLEAGRPSQEI